MAKSYSIDPASPAGDSERTLGDDAIRDQAKGVHETLNVDHYMGSIGGGGGSGYDEDAAGEHEKVTLRTGVAPSGEADKGKLYAKDDASSKAELHFVDEDDTEIQLTQAGAVQGVPVGTVNAYVGATAPAGWLLCDGTAYNGTTNPKYAALFDLIANTYGGSDITDFQVPDLVGYFIRGLDTAGAVDEDARTLGDTQADSFKSHTHTMKATTTTGGGTVNRTNGAGTGDLTSPTGGAETRPKNMALNYIIKF